MHRMKIGLIAAGLLLGFTAVFYFSTASSVREGVTRDVEERVSRAQRVYQQMSRLGGVDFANVAAERARRPTAVAIFDKSDVTARRQAAFEECEAINAGLGRDGRKADIVAVLDEAGKVLARDLNANANWGDDLKAKYPAVAEALKGRAVKDMWNWQGRLHEVAVAPVRKGEAVVGALLLGNVVSARKAQERRELLGVDIAYFHEGKMVTSSFVGEGTGENAKEDVAKTQALNAVAFQGPKLAEAALGKGTPTEVTHFAMEGKDYSVVASSFPGNFADKTTGVVLLASANDVLPLGRAWQSIAIFGLLAIVIALGAAVFTARRFISPLDEIELGVAEVINGNIDYEFQPVGPDFEGLSNSLNVMLTRLLGRDEPNEDAVQEEDEQAPKWKGELMVFEEGDGGGGAGAGALAQESEASYYPRIYGEYVNALRATNKPLDGLTIQAFMAKLRLAEAGLRQKWSCKAVRFQLVGRGDQISFRPVRVG
jgi:hypothetical protein